jgi:uncharacterized protein (TIGR00251 family)
MITLRESEHGISFAVRVQPRASRTGVKGLLKLGDESILKIALHAPPVDGRANDELIEQMAELFNVPQLAVDVIAGSQSRNKVIRVKGRTRSEVEAALAAWA